MKSHIDKFLRVLRIELEDLELDLVALEESTRQKWEENQISNYVFMENMAILREELTGVHKIINDLTGMDTSHFTEMDGFTEHLIKIIKENINNADLPEGVYRLLQRKILKVRDFIKE
jgi:hypothetical protein